MTEECPDKNWPSVMFGLMRSAGVSLFCHIPDAGNDRLISLAEAHNDTQVVLLTTEEEGIAVCAGADLVGRRGVVCMQSSGVGNCPNYLSLVKSGRFPILIMISMRGDYGEQNPWQYPMGEAVGPLLEAMGILVYKVEKAGDLEKATTAALNATAKGGQAAAIILGQKFLGAKGF
tara:strand:+ start:149 stop:673 length:525 start_codon:yes stop_codon:yes gene_type:complete